MAYKVKPMNKEIQQGDIRYLKADVAEGWPREKCKVISDVVVNGTWIVEVSPQDPCDDGIREVGEDQFE